MAGFGVTLHGRFWVITEARAYQAQLSRIKKGDAQKRTYAELVAEAQIKKALRGNTMAAKEIADRSEGRVRQAAELATETMPDINLRVVFEDSDGEGGPEPMDVVAK